MSEKRTTYPQFTTNRDELWHALVTELPSYFTITEGEFGPGRDYHTLNRDLFQAIRDFCDRKELSESHSE